MTVVHEKVWCGYRNKIQVINPRNMKIEVISISHSFDGDLTQFWEIFTVIHRVSKDFETSFAICSSGSGQNSITAELYTDRTRIHIRHAILANSKKVNDFY